MLTDLNNSSKHNRPLSLILGPMKMYLVLGLENVQHIFRNSRYLAKDGLTRQSFQNTDRQVNGRDTSSTGGKEVRPIDDAEAARIGKKLHDLRFLFLAQGPEPIF